MPSCIYNSTAVVACGKIAKEALFVAFFASVEPSSALHSGMALFSSGSLSEPVSTTACVFERNSADDGGAFYSAAGYDVVQDCSFQANFAGTTPEPEARQGAWEKKFGAHDEFTVGKRRVSPLVVKVNIGRK